MAEPRMKIEVPGEVIVNDGVSRFDGKVDVVRIDLRSKRAKFSGTTEFEGAPAVAVMADEDTLHTDATKTGEDTWISFPSHPGWRVLCAEVSRYTLTVVLGKDGPDESARCVAQEGKP